MVDGRSMQPRVLGECELHKFGVAGDRTGRVQVQV